MPEVTYTLIVSRTFPIILKCDFFALCYLLDNEETSRKVWLQKSDLCTVQGSTYKGVTSGSSIACFLRREGKLT